MCALWDLCQDQGGHSPAFLQLEAAINRYTQCSPHLTRLSAPLHFRPSTSTNSQLLQAGSLPSHSSVSTPGSQPATGPCPCPPLRSSRCASPAGHRYQQARDPPSPQTAKPVIATVRQQPSNNTPQATTQATARSSIQRPPPHPSHRPGPSPAASAPAASFPGLPAAHRQLPSSFLAALHRDQTHPHRPWTSPTTSSSSTSSMPCA